MQLLQQWIKNERKRLSLTAHPPGKMLTILVSVGPNDMLNWYGIPGCSRSSHSTAYNDSVEPPRPQRHSWKILLNTAD